MASVGPLIAGAIMLLVRPEARHRLLRPGRAAATRSSGSTCSGSSATPRSTSCCCPAIGIVAEVITVFSRKKLFALQDRALHGRSPPACSASSCGRTTSSSPASTRAWRTSFTITTLLISVPIAEMMFVYIATLYGGSITLTTPMLWALVVHRRVPDRRRDRHLPRRERRGHLLPRHLLRARALPLHVLPDRDHRRVRRRHLLVPEDVRPDDERDARQDSLLGHDHPVQLHLHPAVHHRRCAAITAASTTTRTSRSWPRRAFST